MRHFRNFALPLFILVGCAGNGAETASVANQPQSAAPAAPFQTEVLGQFENPWAMAVLPDGSLLITERAGRLRLRRPDGTVQDVGGTPPVAFGGQGGLGDIVLHPDFARNQIVYLSWAEADASGNRGAVVARARFNLSEAGASLSDLQPVWRQSPFLRGQGHYSHRIAFGPDGKLYISSGERQEFTPAQDENGNLGRIVRLNEDGSVPEDNPWVSRGGVGAQAWTMGNRNVLGFAFAPDGRLWGAEMGPAGGDEFNLLERGENYGYPTVSNGNHYDGRPIPDHDTRPEFNAPEITWTPVISPSSLIFYGGAMFPEWRGQALIGALSGQAIVRVAIEGNSAREVGRHPMEGRIRAIREAADGSLYVLEDGGRGSQGRLLRLTAAR